MPSIVICGNEREAMIAIKEGKEVSIVEGNIPFDYIFSEIIFISEELARSASEKLGWGSIIFANGYWKIIVFALTPTEVAVRLRDVF